MLKVAVLTHPLSSGKTASSSADLIRVALNRGHDVFLIHPHGVTLHSSGQTRGVARQVVSVDAHLQSYAGCKDAAVIDLASCDVLLMRLQPPFDISYFTVCRLLEALESRVLCLNHPSAILAYPEKLFMFMHPEFHPSTVVSSDLQVLREFRRIHGAVVLKPLYDYQGTGVMHVSGSDANFETAVALLIRLYGCAVVAQQYLDAVTDGDKRVFMLDGEPVAAFNRVPQAGSIRASLHAGARAVATDLSSRELAVCSVVGESAARVGLPFVGIDMIGGYVTELSTTSPTGLVQTRSVGGPDVSLRVWEWIERKRQDSHAGRAVP